MTQINLLPWRAELRRQKTIEFASLSGVVGFVALLLIGGAWIHMNGVVDYHNSRIQYLKNELDILNTKLQQIKDLEQTKANLLARMNIIQELQRSRPEVVHLFEELVTTIPDGVWLSNFTQEGKSLTVIGFAESNARVSAYMRNIEASPYLKGPVLEVIESGEKDAANKTAASSRTATFKLHIQQESTSTTEEEDEGEGA